MAKRGGFPGGGMPGNMANLMKQAQQMQRLSLFPVRPVFRLEHRRHGISARNINFRE